MTSQVTTIATLPHDTFRDEIFPHLNSRELGIVRQVCTSWREHAHQEWLWASLPHIPKERRCPISCIPEEEWKQGETTCIEKRVVEFFHRHPIPGKASHLKITFANAPAAYISVWVSEGVKFELPELVCYGDPMCHPNQLLEERVVVFGNTMRLKDWYDNVNYCVDCSPSNEAGSCGANVGGVTSLLKRRYVKEHNETVLNASFWEDCFPPLIGVMTPPSLLPERWYWIAHERVFGWDSGACKSTSNPRARICAIADDRIYALDRTTMKSASVEQ